MKTVITNVPGLFNVRDLGELAVGEKYLDTILEFLPIYALHVARRNRSEADVHFRRYQKSYEEVHYYLFSDSTLYIDENGCIVYLYLIEHDGSERFPAYCPHCNAPTFDISKKSRHYTCGSFVHEYTQVLVQRCSEFTEQYDRI